MLAKCERCGAQAAAYLDLDFRCNRSRCKIRGILNAKDACLRVAMDAPGATPEIAREATKILIECLSRGAYDLSEEDLRILDELKGDPNAGAQG